MVGNCQKFYFKDPIKKSTLFSLLFLLFNYISCASTKEQKPVQEQSFEQSFEQSLNLLTPEQRSCYEQLKNMTKQKYPDQAERFAKSCIAMAHAQDKDHDSW